MNVDEVQQGDIAVISISGSLDALTVDELVQVLDASLADRRTRIVGDLSNVEYMSSAGLRVILSTLKSCRSAGGDFRLAAPSEGVRSLLDMSGFASIVQIYERVDAAVESFEAG